jgi:hypothetical protein
VNSYVCARNLEETGEDGKPVYFLAYVLGFDPEKFTYHLVDVDPEVVPKDQETPAKFVIPMPTSVPARRTRATTIPCHSKVLALWPEEGDWTTVLYEATVKKVPTSAPGLYDLAFPEVTGLTKVPEEYIVRLPEEDPPA